MADEPISALTLLSSYSTADEVEILDVSDTTFASTGTNKRIQFSTLLSMAGVGSAAAQTANTVFAGPSSGGAVVPTFRALVPTDIPSLPASQITSGQIGVA